MLNRRGKKFFKSLVWVSTLVATAAAPAYSADVQRGSMLFSSNCEMCHPGGLNSLTPEKPLRGAAFASKYPQDAMIFNVVRKGIPKTVMSPFSPQRLDDAQVRDIVAFVRSMTPPAKPATKKPAAATAKSGLKSGAAKSAVKPSTNCAPAKASSAKKPVR